MLFKWPFLLGLSEQVPFGALINSATGMSFYPVYRIALAATICAVEKGLSGAMGVGLGKLGDLDSSLDSATFWI